MRILPVVLLLLTVPVHAKKFALVVGGASNANLDASIMPPETVRQHEFGMATARVAYGLTRQGYDVTTLFDNTGTTAEGMPEGLRKMQSESSDMPKLRELGAKSATKNNILAALERIKNTAQAGDEFEFNLNAHGFRSCAGDELGRQGVSTSAENRENTKAGCEHKINLSDPVTGEIVQVATAELATLIKEIDAKGIKTNLNLQSCHSGAAQDLFGDLTNTCVMYGSSANNYAFSCMPADKDDDTSYTSTMDNVVANYYSQYADDMLKDDYFKNDQCLKRLLRHKKEHNIGGRNRYELFMSARRWDLNGEEPSLSSQQDLPYYRSGLFTAFAGLYANKWATEVCATDVDSRINELQTLIDRAQQEAVAGIVNPKRAELARELARYNDLVRRQLEMGATPGDSYQTEGFAPASGEGNAPSAAPAPAPRVVDYRALEVVQNQALEISRRIMSLEREIVDVIDRAAVRPQLPASDPCTRS